MTSESAKVTRVDGEYAVVRFERKAACKSCGMCGMGASAAFSELRVKNTLFARAGDVVTVAFSEGFSLLSALLVYVLPLILGGAALYFGRPLGDGASLGLCLAAMGISYCVAAVLDRRLLSRPGSRAPKMTAVLPVPDGETDENSAAE